MKPNQQPASPPESQVWEVLETAGLADLARRDTERFIAEYRDAVEPYLGEEKADEMARTMSDCVRLAYFSGNLSRLAAYQRRELLGHLATHQGNLPRGKLRRRLDRLFAGVAKIANDPNVPKEVDPS